MYDSGPVSGPRRIVPRADKSGGGVYGHQIEGRDDFEYQGPDFTSANTFEDVTALLLMMKEHGDSLATRSGYVQSPQDLAAAMRNGLQALLKASADQRVRSGNFSKKKLPAAMADAVLAEAGVTSNGGFREAVARALEGSDYIVRREETSRLDQVLEVGDYHPIRVLFHDDPERFKRVYPRSWAEERWNEPGEEMAAVREAWTQLDRQAEQAQKQNFDVEQRQWREQRKEVVLDERFVRPLIFPNGRQKYDDYLVLAADQREQDERARVRAVQLGHAVNITPFSDSSMARSVSHAFIDSVPLGQVYSYTGMNEMQTAHGREMMATRTINIPIQGFPESSITITVLGNTEQPANMLERSMRPYKEVPDKGVRGVIVEQVGGVNVYDTRTRYDRDTLRMLLAAGRQVRAIEQRIMQEFGADIGATQLIAAILQRHRP